MPAERFFIEDELFAQSKIILKGSEFHHLAKVMRTQKGDAVEMVNGKGTLALATVQEVSKEQAFLFINEARTEPLLPPGLILAQAITKPDRLAFILEKGTELGVDAFWFFPGHLSQHKELYPQHQERARAVTIAAMKQCGRLTLPTIELKPILDKWPTFEGQSFFGDLDPEAPWLGSQEAQPSSKRPVIFFTGPESGWSDKEVRMLKEKGAKGVKLHHNVLRTDTASIVALYALLPKF
ncbi:MAG: 16S rRNA (uracil(1498)-N(3))-methyltransferase [Candidatus Protochlamydia sp.]|nr:16S rRNA (uracil(1498)-N(3))-methyltransferase [Candidatus Protochlamydia sp.]